LLTPAKAGVQRLSQKTRRKAGFLFHDERRNTLNCGGRRLAVTAPWRQGWRGEKTYPFLELSAEALVKALEIGVLLEVCCDEQAH
jgi:hypothetical protein